ncbi:MAG: hypothetical protein KatS3mg129_1541 [Leptospiraceae bacterium]|nr:MAG: hypothetical protein KatS3mg129_1541 [Leptospiraceae bacterium]
MKISFFNYCKIFILLINISCLSSFNKNISLNTIESYPSLEENISFPEQQNMIKKIEDTKKRKQVVTYYYANELIRKRIPWKGKEDYEIILRGNAIIVHEKTKIQAPVIYIDPDNNGMIKGKIIVSEKEQGIYLYADGGEYNRNEEYIRIKNNPYMRLKNNQDSILIATKEIYRDMAEKKIIFKEYVKMYGNDWVLFADESIYYDDKKQFILKYNPVLLGKDLYLTARTMLYNSKEQKIQIDQNPVIFTSFTETLEKNKENQNSSKKEKQKEIMYITADIIEYYLKTNKENKGIIQGNVIMQSKTKKMKGEEFVLLGKSLEKIISNKKVTLEDKKENFYLEANYMEYDIKNKMLYLKNHPRLITYDDITKENRKIEQELTANIIERDFDKEITKAKGNVYFKRNNEIAYAEYAIIDEKKEEMELLGNPILKRGDTEIHCKKIHILKDKIEFEKELETKIY